MMKTLLKNLFLPLARYKAATLLNVIGLTAAFASFCIITMQVRYDLTFDKGYPSAGKIYPVQMWNIFQMQRYTSQLSQFLIEEVGKASSDIREIAYIDERDNKAGFFDPQRGPAETITERLVMASASLPSLFGLECVEGSFEGFKAPAAAILSESTAKRLFGSESPVGKALSCVRPAEDSVDRLQVVGIYKDLPDNASLPNGVIFNIENQVIKGKNNYLYGTYLLIDTPEQAVRVEKELTARYPDWFPDTDSALLRPVRVLDLHEYYFTADNQSPSRGNLTTVYSLIAVAVLILLIAIINFINFSTSLVPLRIRSVNTRKVLGSQSAALRMGMIAEAVTVALFSGLLALLVVYLIAGTSFASLIAADMAFGKNLPLLGLTLGIALLSGVIAGIYPAFYSTSFPAALVLKGSFGLSPRGRRLRTGLIAFQYCISIVLIITALFVRQQYTFMRNYDIGIDRADILSTQISVPMSGSREAIAQKLKENPDIRDVTFSFVNVAGNSAIGWKMPYKDKVIACTALPVAPNFLDFMGIPLTQGRDFRESDKQKIDGTYIFNRTAQQEFEIEVGGHIADFRPEAKSEVVGISRDFNFLPLHYKIEPMALYVCGTDKPWPLLHLYAKVNSTKIKSLREEIEQTLLSFDPTARNVVKVQLLDQQLGQRYEKENKLSSLVFVFSLLAVLISTVGAFGLILFETRYRRKEIGLRKVFGATVGDILSMFNRRYMITVGICFLIAAPAAYYIIRQWQHNFAYQAPVTAWIFLAALSIVLLITLGTVSLQSYRSATENPAHSIKSE